MRIEIDSDTHYATNSDDTQNAYNTSDEDPRPAKRRKPRSAPAVTPTTSQEHTQELGQLGPLVACSSATPEIDEAQPQVIYKRPSTFVDNSHQHAPRPSRSPSVASETAAVAEYWEWPFQGFLKSIRIGDNITYNLEFKLPSTPEDLQLPIDPRSLDINHDAAKHSKIRQAPLKPRKSSGP
jgi:hypothetical protein